MMTPALVLRLGSSAHSAVASVRFGLKAATLEGYVAYLTQCVGTTTTPERESGWQVTIAAMKNSLSL